jgi:hypothetical protein
MDKLEAISVNMTTEEMVVLLDRLGVEGYAGLNTDALDELPEQERRLVLDVARRGLIARRILVRDDAGEWQLGQYPLAALGVSLSPERSVMILRGRSREAADAHLFHAAQEVYTTHEVIEEGIHQFLILRDGETWREAILSAAGLDPEGARNQLPQLPLAQVPASALNEAYEEAQSKSAVSAAAVLTLAGVDPTTSKFLATTLSQPVSFATIIAISHGREVAQQDVTLLTGAAGCWLLESQNGQAEDRQFGVTPVTFERARQQVLALIG